MSKTEEAFHRLRADILDARLAPGAPLVISALKEKYGLGWTPLREALPRLEAERLVVSHRNRGYRVAPVSATSLRDLQEARRAVEHKLLSRSIECGGPDWESGIVAAHHLLERTPSPTPGMSEADVKRWEERHEAFHQSLLAAGGSDWLNAFQRQLNDQLHRHHRFMVLGPDSRSEFHTNGEEARNTSEFREILDRTLGIAHHTALMQAALDRDAARARDLLDEHIGFSLAVYAVLWPDAG